MDPVDPSVRFTLVGAAGGVASSAGSGSRRRRMLLYSLICEPMLHAAFGGVGGFVFGFPGVGASTLVMCPAHRVSPAEGVRTAKAPRWPPFCKFGSAASVRVGLNGSPNVNDAKLQRYGAVATHH